VGLWIQENTGMNLTFVYDTYDRSLFVKGLFYTLGLMASCVFFSLLLGTLGAMLAESRLRWLGRLVHGVAIYGRMTPPLLQMYLLFFGVGALLWSGLGVIVSPMWVAVWCLSYYTGSSIMVTLVDSSNHLRIRQSDFRLHFSCLPEVVELSAGAVKSALINVTKQSVMASALAIPELISATTSIMSDQGNVNVMMNVFLVAFLLLITLWMGFFNWLERRLRTTRESS
jgi:polar amino acid transport system substrate-binding protein